MAISPFSKAPQPKKSAESAPPPDAKGLRVLVWGSLVVGSFMLVSLPTVMLVFFGLLPSIVAWIIDRTEQKYATACVLGMNFSGLFPFLLEIWFKNHTLDAATRIMTDVFDLMVIYGSAAFGWMLYIALPPVVTTFLSVMSENRVAILKQNQANIIEEWGGDVANVVDSTEVAMPKTPA